VGSLLLLEVEVEVEVEVEEVVEVVEVVDAVFEEEAGRYNSWSSSAHDETLSRGA
jgi:hypothetical protein